MAKTFQQYQNARRRLADSLWAEKKNHSSAIEVLKQATIDLLALGQSSCHLPRIPDAEAIERAAFRIRVFKRQESISCGGKYVKRSKYSFSPERILGQLEKKSHPLIRYGPKPCGYMPDNPTPQPPTINEYWKFNGNFILFYVENMTPWFSWDKGVYLGEQWSNGVIRTYSDFIFHTVQGRLGRILDIEIKYGRKRNFCAFF